MTWQDECVQMFREHQTSGWFHPYTCRGGGGEHSGLTLEPEKRDGDLYLVCPHGDHEQRVTAFDAFLVASVASHGNPFGGGE